MSLGPCIHAQTMGGGPFGQTALIQEFPCFGSWGRWTPVCVRLWGIPGLAKRPKGGHALLYRPTNIW